MEATQSTEPNPEFVRQVVEKAGGQSAVARHFKIKPQSVGDWIAAGTVPANRAIGMEQLSGFPRQAIRPDIYPPEQRA